MADTPAPAKAGGKGFWAHKLGPFPVYVWGIGIVAVGGYYWYTHYGPGASKQQAAAQPRQAPRTRITETIYYYGRRGRGRARQPRPAGSAGAAGTAAQAAAAGIPAQYGGAPGPGGTMAGVPAPPPNSGGGTRPPGRKDRDRDKRRHVAVGPQQQATVNIAQPTGQPVSPDTGQPVYWEWTHAHRPPEVSYPVPAPQAAYAPGTTGATNAATAAGAADALAG